MTRRRYLEGEAGGGGASEVVEEGVSVIFEFVVRGCLDYRVLVWVVAIEEG